MDQPGADRGRRIREVARSDRIDGERPVFGYFGPVDVVEGSGIDDPIGPQLLDQWGHGASVTDVELRVIPGVNVVVAEQTREVPAQLAACSSDENPH
jgi:hypothetical protein